MYDVTCILSKILWGINVSDDFERGLQKKVFTIFLLNEFIN